jgi:hypothetical protein
VGELFLLLAYCMALVLLAWWWSRAGLARFPLTASGLTCAGCGYDLGGLPAGAHCPECGGWRRVTEVVAERRVPLWVPAWAAGGSVLANAPGLALLGVAGVFEWSMLVAPGVFAGLLLVSSILIAQRPRKNAAKAAIALPLTVQCIGQVIETVPLYHNPPTGFLSGLGYFFAIAAPTFYASVALGLLCIIGVVTGYVRSVTP